MRNSRSKRLLGCAGMWIFLGWWGLPFSLQAAPAPPAAPGGVQELSAPTGSTAPARQPAPWRNYTVFSFNDLGMHCIDNDFSTCSILPPFNNVHTQVIKKGYLPTFLSPADANVFYSATYDQNQSINTTSLGKTNFWRYVYSLFGVFLPPDKGLLGARMPGIDNTPQPFLLSDPVMNWFTAAGIPLTDIDDNRQKNHTPLMLVEAVSTSNGSLLASLPTALPISTEIHCYDCHRTGMDGASPGLQAKYGIKSFSSNPVIKVQFRENILTLHDAINRTTLSLSKPVLCASCHYSAALDINKTGPTGNQVGHTFLSQAIHRHHGKTLDHTLPDANNPPILPEEGVASCYNCHPGKSTQCLRGVHATAGLQCQNCHGDMLAVGGQFPLANGTTRRPWIDLPKCQSCHTGDALSHKGNELILRMAYDPADPAATPRMAANLRFAEQPNLLYKESLGHGGMNGSMACEACHNSTHAEWPVGDPQANDNVAPVQLQGYAASIRECNVCHGEQFWPAKNLAGPHGMHVVNNPDWWRAGHKLAYQDPVQRKACHACHGTSFEGTVLSRTGTDRVLRTILNHPITIPKGTPVNCLMCHANPPA